LTNEEVLHLLIQMMVLMVRLMAMVAEIKSLLLIYQTTRLNEWLSLFINRVMLEVDVTDMSRFRCCYLVHFNTLLILAMMVR